MFDLLPQAYLIGLIVLLGAAAWLVGRQILRVSRDERALARLGGGDGRPTDSAGLYELASVQLRKRLYGQACDNLRQALRRAEQEQAPADAMALIENALGYAHAAESRFPVAIRHYRAALRARPDYPVALNNLAFALDKQSRPEEARSTYEKVLSVDPGNRTAQQGLRRLDRRRGVEDSSAA